MNLSDKYGVMVIDPHGDLVEQISRFKLFTQPKYRERLVCLGPTFSSQGLTTLFNPIEHQFHHLTNQYEKRNRISLKAAELLLAFENIFQNEFSHNMELMLVNGLRVLMEHEGTNLVDLLDLLNPELNSPLLELAKEHWDERVRIYFDTVFPSQRLAATKMSVLTRLSNALTQETLRMMLSARKSSFNIGQMLEEGKIILVNCSQGSYGQEGTRILGTLLLAELTTFALGRANIPEKERSPVICVIDETQNFVNKNLDKLLSESRKYKCYLILSHQFLAQFSGENMLRVRKSILANTDVKFVGKSSSDDKKSLSREMQIDLHGIEGLEAGKFAFKSGSKKGIPTQMRSDFVIFDSGANHPAYMSSRQYDALMNEQRRKYYRKEGLEDKNFRSKSSNKKKDKFQPKIDKLL